MTETEFSTLATALWRAEKDKDDVHSHADPPDLPITMAGGSLMMHSPKGWDDRIIYSSTQYVAGIWFASGVDLPAGYHSLSGAMDIKIILRKGGDRRRISISTKNTGKQLQIQFEKEGTTAGSWDLLPAIRAKAFVDCGVHPHQWIPDSIIATSPSFATASDVSEFYLQIVFSPT